MWIVDKVVEKLADKIVYITFPQIAKNSAAV